MTRSSQILVAAVVLLACGRVEARRDRAAEVDSLLSLAADTSVTRPERKDLLKQAVGLDKTGRALHALARFHISLNTPTERHSAGLCLKRALQLERDNADYLATQAELLWRSLRRPASYEKARYVVELDPDHVWGLYWSGRFITWSWMMTYHTYQLQEDELRRPGGNAWSAGRTFRHFEYQNLDLASGVEFLERALRADPDHWPSRLELGLVFYMARHSDRLVALFREDTARHPERVASWFFLGLGLQQSGELKAAYGAYREGLNRMPDRQQRFMQSIFMMRSKKAEKKAEALPDEETIRRFWFGRDPLFLTAENERLLEQCRRVAYADLRYSDPINGYSGWETDRGQAYIRFGDPKVQAMIPPGADLGLKRTAGEERDIFLNRGPTHAFKSVGRTEVWSYDGFEVTFTNTNSWDSWRAGPASIGFRPVSFSELIEKIPDYYQYPLRFDLPYQLAQFRDANGMTKLELYYGINGERIAHRPARPGVDSVRVNQALFLFDAEWDTVYQTAGLVRMMPVVDYASTQVAYLLASERVLLKPGAYYLAAEAEDQVTDRVGTLRDTLQVRQFGRDHLELSSLLMARRIVELDNRPPGRERYLVLPNPLLEAPRSGTASFYFEVYNLSQDTFGATHYRVTYQTRVIPESGGPEDQMAWATAVSSEFEGLEAWEPFRLTLELDDKSTGLREFRVVVDDLQDLERAEETTRFRVRW